jgi:hypothetical protein
MRMDRRAYTVALTVAAAIVVLLIVSLAPRAQPPVATGAPSSPQATTAVPRVLFTHPVVLDTVPGGGAVTTDAYDSFEIEAAGRPRQSHAVAGVAIGIPIFDGRARVAYWRVASLTRSLTIAGPYDLVVWDIQADRDRVLLTLRDEGPGGTVLWSADGKSLVVPTRARPATGRDTLARLLVIDVDSGAMRVLGAPAVEAVSPLFADAQIVAGRRGTSYVVLDATSGAVRTETTMRVRSTPMGEYSDLMSSPDGAVLEVLRRFENDAGPLWVWNARDPGRDLAKVEERGISDPIFWPGRTEVVFSRATGLVALDYRSGQTRPLVSPPAAHRVLAVDAGGRFAVLLTGSANQLFERIDDELKARPDLQVTVGPTLRPLGVLLP